MKVRAIRPGYDGFALRRRRVGDVFDIPIDPKKFSSRWLEAVEDEVKPEAKLHPQHKTTKHKFSGRHDAPADERSTGNAEVI